MKWNIYFLIFTFVFIMGCPYGKAIKRGDAAYAEGNYTVALEEYEAAQRIDPNSAEAAKKILQTKEKLVAEYTDAAKRELTNGNFLSAIEQTRLAYEKLPDSGAVGALVDDVKTQTLAKANSLEAQSQFAAAIKLQDELATLPTVREEAESAKEQTKQKWVDTLIVAAQEAEKAEHFGTALLNYAKATDLSQSPEHGGKRDGLRNKMLSENRYNVATTGRSSKEVMAIVSQLLSIGENTTLRIHPLGTKIKNANATLNVNTKTATVKTTKQSRNVSVEYQSGTKQVENPFWKSKQDKLLDEERRLTDYENDLSKAEADVVKYETAVAKEGDTPGVSTGAEQSLSRARSEVESDRRRVQSQRDTVQRAREDAADEPRTKEEPVYSTLNYAITTHNRTAKLQVNGSIDDVNDKTPKRAFAKLVSNTQSDETHSAYPQANIAEDPLQLPSADRMKALIYTTSAKFFAEKTFKIFETWRDEVLASAATAEDDSLRTNRLVIYVITNPAKVDPKVGADLSALSGVPDPIRVLTPN